MKALVFDELLQAIDHVQIPVGIGPADVTGMEPPVRVDHRLRCLRIVQVTLHDLRSAYPYLAEVAGRRILAARQVDDPELGVGDRRTD